ncbi:calcium/sodium antiporter [Marivirga arenosa]|uniref:Calcium/sodium antiporter n=1 Tax=Marivirga arenosa TaxID=3059076 RepID=A0AA52EZP2_9BACT|nr:calcium/sodium antiporter [Marivirga sp. BKB1-2]WNB18457.1 calcium/sodium antiporter [Marivirga sp. BKB1-2]
MALFLNTAFIILGFILLIKGADFMVSGASSFAKKFNVSEIAIGLTIVAMGTSAPELVVNLVSGSQGLDDVVFGNLIGSNIFNLFLILGIAGTIRPLIVQSETVWKEIPFSMGVVILLFILVNDQFFFGQEFNSAGYIDGFILLLLFVSFIYYVFYNVKNNNHILDMPDETKIYNHWVTLLMILGGITGLVLGGKLVVDNAVDIARSFELSEKLIGLTILAAGTSLPELATSAVAAYRNRADIAIGNVIGSNIFNLTFILGINSIVKPLNYNTQLNLDFYVLIGGSILLFIFMFTLKNKKLDRWEAILFLFTFLAYLTYIFIRK